MCLSINPFSRKRIVKEDITVYKVLKYKTSERVELYDNPLWVTPYRDADVHINKALTGKLSRGFRSVNAGIHSYDTFEGAEKAMLAMRFDEWYNVVARNKPKYTYAVFTATIPKGAEYYHGTHEYDHDRITGSYASNTLLIEKEHA